MITTSADLSVEPPRWRLYLVRATVALLPLSINLERVLGPMKRPWYLSPFDLLLPILVLLLIADLVQRRPWARFKLPPVPALVLAGLALLSCVWIAGFPGGETLRDWSLGAANPIVVIVLPAWVFMNVSTDPAEYRRLALLLGASFLVCLLIAAFQYAGPMGLPFDPNDKLKDLHGASNVRVAGWYDFRALFGAQTALLAPAAAAFALLDRNLIVRVAAGALAVLALCVTLAAGGLVAACAGIVAVAAAVALQRGGWLKAVAALLALLFVVEVILPRLPRKNPEALWRGLTFYADADGKKKPTARLRRYQAAFDLLLAPSDFRDDASRPNWLTGVGAGRYRVETNKFFQAPYDKPGARTDDEAQFDMGTDERFTFGLLETDAVELGVPGLLLLLFFFVTWCGSALAVFPSPPWGEGRVRGCSSALDAPSPPTPLPTGERGDILAVLALAAFGAGGGALVLSIFANPVLRGAGPGGTFAFCFALALWCKQQREDDLKPQMNADER